MGVSGGIINVYKPVGMTSFAVVSRIRRLFGIKRAGHCGTLDPFAQGVLPICLDRATGVVRYMEGYDKRYRVVMVFGAQTDTQDCTGKVVYENYPDADERRRIADSGFAALKDALKGFVGNSDQLPPMYSAIKINGTPLYKYARQGIEVERAKRRITVYSAELTDVSAEPEFVATVDIHCTKGTYIRTICEDLGVSLTYGAYARELYRTACGPFGTENSVSIEDIEAIVADTEDPWQLFGKKNGFFQTDYAISTMPRMTFSAADSLRLIQGQLVEIKEKAEYDERFAAYCEPGSWIGVVKPVPPTAIAGTDHNGYYIKAERIFADADNFRE
ncbi:MAG: tRNA pseudouridine(55) synthase TruB [Saccharofermentanales bacterium]